MSHKKADESDEEEDVEKALARERDEIRAAASAERRFQNTNTHCNNVIFIRTTLEHPTDLAHKIFQDMVDTGTQKVRYAQRMIPITMTCKTNPKSIEKCLNELLKEKFETPFGTGYPYKAVLKIRSNETVKRMVILPMIDRIVKELNPLHRVCLDEPEVVVVFEVIRNVCLMCVTDKFEQFRKYNFHEVIKAAKSGADPEKAADTEQGESGAIKCDAEIVDGARDDNADSMADNVTEEASIDDTVVASTGDDVEANRKCSNVEDTVESGVAGIENPVKLATVETEGGTC